MNDSGKEIEREFLAVGWPAKHTFFCSDLFQTLNRKPLIHSSGGDGFFSFLFFLACENFGRMFDKSFPACAFFFFKVEITLRTHIHFLPQNQSTVVQQAETTVTECSLYELRVSSYPNRFPHYAWTAA